MSKITSKKLFLLTVLISLALSLVGISNFTPKTYAANGKATFNNNLPQSADATTIAGNLFVCVNGKMLGNQPLNSQSSVDFSAAAGNYNFTVLDPTTTINSVQAETVIVFNGTNWDVFCNDVTIYNQDQIVSTGNFDLLDDKPTKIDLKPGTFDIKVSPFIIAFNIGDPISTPGVTALTLQNGGPFGRICIDGVATLPTSYNNNTNIGTWNLAPGTYEVSDAVFNLNVQEGYFCGGEYDDNTKHTIILATDTTADLGNLNDYLAVFSNPNFSYKLETSITNPSPNSSSSQSSQSKSIPESKAMITVRTGGSDF